MYSFDDIKMRVVVADILLDHGIEPRGNRIPCPLHNGNNPTSFSFNRSGFCCFSCGASGGLLDLVQHFRHCNRITALCYLEDLSGISLGAGKTRPCIQKWKHFPPNRSAKLEIAKTDLRLLHLQLDTNIILMIKSKKAMEEGLLSPEDYYACLQKIEYELEYEDAEAMRLNGIIHTLEKKGRR